MDTDPIRDDIIHAQIKIILRGINRWRSAETASSIISEICAVGSGLLAFSVSYFDDAFLAYLSGSVGFLSVGLRQFSSYCFRRGTSQATLLNNLLVANGEQPIPDILAEPSTTNRSLPVGKV
jgi:hypothetical protein